MLSLNTLNGNQAEYVYGNQAEYVCSLSNFAVLLLFLSVYPAPHWYAHCLRCVVAVWSEFSRQIEPTHVTFHRPAETLRVLMVGRRAGDSTSRARQR